jgi:hypothetical protein
MGIRSRPPLSRRCRCVHRGGAVVIGEEDSAPFPISLRGP